MTNEEKGLLYEQYLHEADTLQREISKIKSENVTNIPPDLQSLIDNNHMKISFLEIKVQNLFK
jgi:hypothetical protein